MNGYIYEIDAYTAKWFLLPRHYSGRSPSISKAFGWYKRDTLWADDLVAVITFGKPASPNLCAGVCGEEWAESVYELNRLCRVDEWREPLSLFVATALRTLKKENWIIVSYSDTAMNHHGYIYQACNFMYTGCTRERTDMYVPDGKHSRHYKNAEQGDYRLVRSSKHRYVYFCTSDKKLKRTWAESLRYGIEPYPKGDNSNYILGDYIKQELIRSNMEG